MNRIKLKIAISDESKKRMKTLSFGDKATNICAGEGNPMRHCTFVEYKKKSTTNKWKIKHTEHLARLTDGKGHFGDYEIDVIYPGHLDSEECKKLFDPVWESQYGS